MYITEIRKINVPELYLHFKQIFMLRFYTQIVPKDMGYIRKNGEEGRGGGGGGGESDTRGPIPSPVPCITYCESKR